MVRPFVWRRSLDFMALEEIRRLTTRIRDAYRGPLEPGPGPEPRPWTAEHVALMRELAAAVVAVLDRRRAWDTLRHEWRPPH